MASRLKLTGLIGLILAGSVLSSASVVAADWTAREASWLAYISSVTKATAGHVCALA